MNSCAHCSLPFDSAYALAQHMWKSTDNDHETYESLDDAFAAIYSPESNSEPNSKSPDGGVPNGQSPNISEETVTDDSNPVFDSPDAEPTSTPNDDPACPDCGGSRYFDASEHTKYDYGCPDCSTEDAWVVWNE